MRFHLPGPVHVLPVTAAAAVLVASGCAQAEPTRLSPDAEATIVAAVEATVAVRLAATPGLISLLPNRPEVAEVQQVASSGEPPEATPAGGTGRTGHLSVSEGCL